MSKEEEIRRNYEVRIKELQDNTSTLTQHCSQLIEDRAQLLQDRDSLVLQLHQSQEGQKIIKEQSRTERER